MYTEGVAIELGVRPGMVTNVLRGVLAVALYWGLWNSDDRLPSTLIEASWFNGVTAP